MKFLDININFFCQVFKISPTNNLDWDFPINFYYIFLGDFMFKKFAMFPVALLFVSVLFLNSCSEDSTSNKPEEFVADDNTFSGFMSWKLEATIKGADPALGMAHAGNDSTVTREIYIKNGQNLVNGKFPVGTVIVKHSKNTSGTVNEYTAMAKRGNNFNTTGGDWEWFMLNPDGKIITGENNMKMRGANLMDGMCVGCHSGAAAKDYVFSKK